MEYLKFSRYNFLFETGGKTYLYNALSTAIAGLDGETAHAVRNGNVLAIKQEYIDTMKEQRFLLHSAINEVDEYMYFYNRTRFGKSAQVLSINFIPSYSCNLACPYCFQGQEKENVKMDTSDVKAVLAFVDSRIAESQANDVPIRKINAHLYGGEPLLQKDTLFVFSDGINAIAEKHGCGISFSMTSNLTLLDDEIIAFINRYRISTQVSIDGTKLQHDTRRVTKTGQGTYDLIISNLERLKDKDLTDLVVLRLNVDKNNLDEAENVFKAVREYSNDIYFGFLSEFKGFNDHFAENCVPSESFTGIVSQKFNDIYRKYGFAIPQAFGKMSPCSLNCENKFLVDCRLDVYKCELLLNQPVARCGHLTTEGVFIPEAGFYRQMKHSPELFPECLECKLLPLCAGGCPARAYIARNKNDGILGEKNCLFSEAILVDYLKDYVRRQE